MVTPPLAHPHRRATHRSNQPPSRRALWALDKSPCHHQARAIERIPRGRQFARKPSVHRESVWTQTKNVRRQLVAVGKFHAATVRLAGVNATGELKPSTADADPQTVFHGRMDPLKSLLRVKADHLPAHCGAIAKLHGSCPRCRQGYRSKANQSKQHPHSAPPFPAPW